MFLFPCELLLALENHHYFRLSSPTLAMKHDDIPLHSLEGITSDSEPTNPDDHQYFCSRVAQLRKIDSRLLSLFDLKLITPMAMTAFVLGIKTNVFPYTVTFGLNDSLKLSGNQLSWLYATPHVLQIPMQFPVAWLLTDRFLPIDTFSGYLFGMDCCLFLLAEITFSASVVICNLLQSLVDVWILHQLVWTTWVFWCREELPWRMSMWYLQSGVATIVSKPFLLLAVRMYPKYLYLRANPALGNEYPQLLVCINHR